MRVCVFAGSSNGNDPLYLEHAALLGKELASRGYELVYGGGNVGLMGACCEAHHNAGGKVISVIPEPFAPKEVSGESLGHVFKTADMHSRKQIMATVSDMFIALPGVVHFLYPFPNRPAPIYFMHEQLTLILISSPALQST